MEPLAVDLRTIPELQAAMAAGELTSRALVEGCLARVAADDRVGRELHALTTTNPAALAEADALDAERAATGPRGPLHGIPVVIKDNVDVAGLPTTAGSAAMADVVPPDDAFQAARLRAAGAVVVAKTNLHEFAFGWETIGSLVGATRNPHDPTRVPGGSSGGTAAAVAAGFAVAGIGTDTCGSIRVPAALCGLVGIRATKGLTSIDGVVPMSRTQDVAGPLARRVVDAALLLDATVGFDPADPITATGVGRAPVSYADGLDALPGEVLRGVRLGRLDAAFGADADDEPINAVVDRALDDLVARGATVVAVTIPDLADRIPRTSLISEEFQAHLEDWLAATPGAPPSLDAIIATGLVHPQIQASLERCRDDTTYGTAAHRERLLGRDELRIATLAAMAAAGVDAVVYPAVNRPPAPLGERQPGTMPNTALAPQSGLPAVTVPAGELVDGLPVGVELLGRPFEEAFLLRLAAAHERVADERRRALAAGLGAGLDDGVEVLERPAAVVVGLAVEAPFEQLGTVVPAGWGILRFRLREIEGRVDGGLVELSVPIGGGIHREVLGAQVEAAAPAPGGMERVELPPARWAATPVEDDDVGAAFAVLQAAIATRGEVHDGVLLDEHRGPDASAPRRLLARLAPRP